MTLTGLPLATLAQAFGAAAVAVTLLYLLRLRRRRVQVPFSPLWTRLLAESESRSLLRRLKRLLSWLLALAFLLLVAAAAGDPRPEQGREDARTFVVLLDGSVSMRATDGNPTRFDGAVAEARRVVDGLRTVDRAMLVLAGASVEPLTPFTDDRRVLLDALDHAAPGEAAADLDRALELAGAALHGRAGPQVVLVTDGAGRTPDASEDLPALTVVIVGERADNVGILAFNARHYRSNRREHEVFLEVRNDSDRDARCRVSLLADDVLSEVLPLEVPAHGTARRFFGGLAITGRRLEARLEVVEGPTDLLEADNRAFAVLPPSEALDVTLVTSGNLFLEAALLLDESIELRTMAPADYPGDGPAPDAWLFDRWAPPEPPAQSALFVAPPADRSPWPVRKVVPVPEQVRVKAGHPLVRWIGIADLNAGQAQLVATDGSDEIVVRAGSVPLVVARDAGDVRRVVWTFDPLDSDLPLRTSFPLLLMHTFEWFARAEDDFVSSLQVGRSWRVPVGSRGDAATLVEPGGERRQVPVEGGVARLRGRRVGFHELLLSEGSHVALASSLTDPEESDLTPRKALLADRSTPLEMAGTASGGRPPWVLLALLALAWLALEWPSFHRRWTV